MKRTERPRLPIAAVSVISKHSIDGGMPEHGHGLPTRPRVTRHLIDGATHTLSRREWRDRDEAGYRAPRAVPLSFEAERVDNPLASHTLFPIYVAALLWGGLWLRDRRVSALYAPPAAA